MDRKIFCFVMICRCVSRRHLPDIQRRLNCVSETSTNFYRNLRRHISKSRYIYIDTTVRTWKLTILKAFPETHISCSVQFFKTLVLTFGIVRFNIQKILIFVHLHYAYALHDSQNRQMFAQATLIGWWTVGDTVCFLLVGKWDNKYYDICLTVYHWYKYYRQPTRCNNNGLLITPISSTCFGKLFCPSSGALDCVLQLVV